MARYFNRQPIELLAPAGTFEIFQALVETKCDAIYFGGRILNMRLIRKGYNLSDEEVTEAVRLAHEKNKKVYITINNLNSREDLEEAKMYLKFLHERAKPDALIVQDPAIMALIKESNLDLSVHASVMMNVHNLATIKALKEMGIKRVVVSRDFPLSAVRYFKDQVPDMEYEYFAHGDMCVAHGSQCYFSSLLFGMSSNRGRCLKPCRWWYKMKKDGKVYDTAFPLAVKDMCMYENLPEMIEAGVTSFKIEGRMREKDFIVQLVNDYGDAIDRYIADPLHFDRMQNFDRLYETRKRDLSTAYAFGKPGLSNINSRYEGTGKFFSTGKMFSKPTEEKGLEEDKITAIRDCLNTYPKHPKTLKLSVKVNNYSQALSAIEKGADIIYLSGNVYLPDLPWSVKEINQLCSMKGPAKIILSTPKIFDEQDFSRYAHLLSNNRFAIDGIQVSNLGAIEFFKEFGYDIVGDYALNIYNSDALNFYGQKGLKLAALSVEMPVKDLTDTVSRAEIPTEVIVHGLMDVMHLEHDLYENAKLAPVLGEEDNRFVKNDILVLFNEAGEYPVFKDDRGRNHVHNTKEMNLLPVVHELAQIGLDIVRIEAQTYTLEQLAPVLHVYRAFLDHKLNLDQAMKALKPNFYGYTSGSLYHEVK